MKRPKLAKNFNEQCLSAWRSVNNVYHRCQLCVGHEKTHVTYSGKRFKS